MMGVAAFFTGLMLFAPDVNPFATLSPAPADGIGLNPLLQHPSMMIHPPMLYSGYVAFTIPFAFAIGALITRRLDAEWIRATRRFALIAWAFLGFGLLLGARWSYTELGWGGYWAWDPVENAALMPWLLGTAFLHSIMVQEKRGMLKVWNACLVVGTFSLALLGTFLVRSGVLQSIHAFGDNTVGPYILGLIAVVLIGSTALIVSRLDDLRSREADRLAGLARVGLPGQQPAAGGALRGDLLGHLLPADLGTVHRHQGLAGGALVRPLHDAAGDPAGPLHRDRAAAGLAPGQLGLGQAGLPDAAAGRRGRPRSRWRCSPTPPTSPGRSPSSSSPPSPSPASAQEFWNGAAARRKLSGGSMPAALVGGRLPQPPPLRRLHRPHRHRRAADRDRRLLQLPDQPRRRPAAGREHRRRRPHDHLREADRRASTARSSPSAPCCGSRRTASRSRPCARAAATSGRPGSETGTIGSFFDGEATSEVGLKAGLGSDLWTADAARHQRRAAAGAGGRQGLRSLRAAAPRARRRSAKRWRR